MKKKTIKLYNGMDRSVITIAGMLLVVCVFLSISCVFTLSLYRDYVFHWGGGEIFTADKKSTFKQAIDRIYSGKSESERLALRGFKEGAILYVAPTAKANWLSKTLYQRWVPYWIVGVFLAGFLYLILTSILSLVPSWYFANAANIFRKVADALNRLGEKRLNDFNELIRVAGNGTRIGVRLKKLQQHIDRENDRDLCREANEGYSQTDQVEVFYVLMPLRFVEWILPILGFIGTVLGVQETVVALKQGMNILFDIGKLNEGAMTQFMAGFDGLVLAFDTTLFGLMGLGIIGLGRFILRKSAIAVITKVDELSSQAINYLKKEDITRLIAESLIKFDKDMKPIRDKEGLLIPRWTEVLVEIDGEGHPRRDRNGQMIPIWDTAIFELDDQGNPLVDQNGRKIPRIERIKHLLETGLFEPQEDNEDDQLLPMLGGVHKILLDNTSMNKEMHSSLMRYIFQIVGDEGKEELIPLLLYSQDPETDELVAREVLGRIRSVRQHREMLMWTRLCTEDILAHIGQAHPSPGTAGRPPKGYATPGRLVVAGEQAPVQLICASSAGFAIIRKSNAHRDETEIISGDYVEISGDRKPREIDRHRTPDTITAVGFVDSIGQAAMQLCVYMPFIPGTPWKMFNKDELALGTDLVRCSPAFLNNNRLLSQNVACIYGSERNWLIFAAQSKSNGSQIKLYGLPLDRVSDDPISFEDSAMEGEFLIDSALPGHAYALAVKNGGGTKILLLRGGEKKPEVFLRNLDHLVADMTFDNSGMLYCACNDAIWELTPDFKTINKIIGLPQPQAVSKHTISVSGTHYLSIKDSGELLSIFADQKAGVNPEIQKTRYHRAVTSLCSSSDGHCVFVGCADGSVYSQNE